LTPQTNKNRLIRKLSKDLQEENLALFAGAGLSVSAGFVDWTKLLEPIAEDLGLDIEKEKTDLVSLAQYHYNAKGNNRSKLNQLLITNFCENVELTPNHKILARLPISTYWTTNYDKLIEKSLEDAGKKPDLKYTKAHLAQTTPRRDAIVYKMHGDIAHPNDAVLTRLDYEKYHIDRQPFISALTGDITSKTFLFLGFSFTDPNLDYILSRVRIAYDENQRMHHCILRNIQIQDCEDQAEFEYRKRKQGFFIQDLLGYGIESFMIDDYKEITEILEGVEKQYRRNTVFISGAAHSYAPQGEVKSNEFVFNLSKEIIEADFNIVSGFGLGIGSSVITGALEHIYMKKGETIRSERLVLRPFPQYSSAPSHLKKLWTEYRKDMLSFSGIALFLFGNKLNDDKVVLSNGMREEFEIAKEKGLFLLPIGAAGYMAKELWNEVNENFDELNDNAPDDVKAIFSYIGDENLTFDEMFEHVIKILKLLKK
jgi:hypothetical protein